jgi:hypothetical protein
MVRQGPCSRPVPEATKRLGQGRRSRVAFGITPWTSAGSVRQVRSPVITRTRDVEMVFGNAPTLEEVLRVLAEIEAAVNG